MVKKEINLEIEIPEGVNVQLEKGTFIVKGEKEELKRKLFHPRIKTSLEGKKVIFSVQKATKSDKKLVFTYVAHLKNMFTGVTDGFTYKMKICSSHFPMTVTSGDNKLEVKNFIGEKNPRILKLSEKVSQKAEKEAEKKEKEKKKTDKEMTTEEKKEKEKKKLDKLLTTKDGE